MKKKVRNLLIMLLTLVVVAGIGTTVFVRVNRVDTKALSYSGSSSYKSG